VAHADDAGGFRQLSSDEVFRGRIISLHRLQLADPDGQPFEREVVHHPGAVAIVPVGADRKVTLVRQFRPAIGRAVFEIPAGTRDVVGEAPELTARRELAEEAGLDAGTLRRLAALNNSPGYSDQLTIIFLATDLSPCATDRSGIEEHFMTLEEVDLDDVLRLVDDGVLTDSTTVTGLLLARAVLGGES
jgi:ADP-ribose pyrophosphatase